MVIGKPTLLLVLLAIISADERFNSLNGLFYDIDAQAFRPVELRLRNFREPGSWPAIATFPWE
jgi:hypothetical protein